MEILGRIEKKIQRHKGTKLKDQGFSNWELGIGNSEFSRISCMDIEKPQSGDMY
jgi:hypothetical protein